MDIGALDSASGACFGILSNLGRNGGVRRSVDEYRISPILPGHILGVIFYVFLLYVHARFVTEQRYTLDAEHSRNLPQLFSRNY